MSAALWNVLSDPWGEPILRRAFLEVALLGIAGGALGCWVLHHRMAYSAESMAHGLLPGLVLASLAGLPLLLGGAVSLVATAVAVAFAGRIAGIDRDTAVAVVVTSLFGLGVLLALSPDSPPGLQNLLFGDPLGISDGDLLLAAGLVVTTAVALGLLHSRLLVVGFDRSAAHGLGVSAGRVDLALMGMLAVALLVAVQGLGNLLVVALLVAPAAAARRLTRTMPAMLATASVVAIAAGWAGMYLSYHARTAAGASIAGMLVLAVAAAEVASRAGRSGRRRAA
ncbi:MAG: metal ABC transporter permease [Solirubrobacteraceae bacterium]